MKDTLNVLCAELQEEIKAAYEQGTPIEAAERLASKFLHAQLMIADRLRDTDLDSRMKKAGLKAVKAAVYMEAATKSDKKPSDVMLGAIVDMNELVNSSQESLDTAEVDRDQWQAYFNVFKEAHIHFRSIAKGRFE